MHIIYIYSLFHQTVEFRHKSLQYYQWRGVTFCKFYEGQGCWGRYMTAAARFNKIGIIF
jgi:hypothetical protein